MVVGELTTSKLKKALEKALSVDSNIKYKVGIKKGVVVLPQTSHTQINSTK